jgi:hypothetical protein
VILCIRYAEMVKWSQGTVKIASILALRTRRTPHQTVHGISRRFKSKASLSSHRRWIRISGTDTWRSEDGTGSKAAASRRVCLLVKAQIRSGGKSANIRRINIPAPRWKQGTQFHTMSMRGTVEVVSLKPILPGLTALSILLVPYITGKKIQPADDGTNGSAFVCNSNATDRDFFSCSCWFTLYA